MRKFFLLVAVTVFFAGCASVMESKRSEGTANERQTDSVTIPPENWWIVIRDKQVKGTFAVNGRSQPLKTGNVSISIKEIFANTELKLSYGLIKEKGEGSFYYPLPDDASVNDFIMTVGKRKIRAVIMSEKEASVIYSSALERGLKAQIVTRAAFDEMLIDTAVAEGESVSLSFSFKNILRYSEDGFVYSLPSLEKAAGAEVDFTLDLKSDFGIKNFTNSFGEKKEGINSVTVTDNSDRSLADGFHMRVNFGERSFCCLSTKREDYAVWNGETKVLTTGFGRINSGFKEAFVPGKNVSALAAHNAICQKMREGASIDEIVSLAMKYRMLTPLTSFLAVDASKK